MDTHEKRKFMLERVILFSDAVFAIAITLLVIELKLPELSENSNRALSDSLLHTIPHLFSFFMSFFIIGIYWTAHHRMFGYVVNYDLRLLWLNLFLLCFIVLMPFSSNIFGVYGHLNYAFYVYVANITMVALFNFLLYRYISKPVKKLSQGLENPELVKYYMIRAWSIPFCFGIGVILTLLIPGYLGLTLSRMSPILIWPALTLIRKKFKDVVVIGNN